MSGSTNRDDMEWALKQAALAQDGIEIVNKACESASDYISTMVDDMDDKNTRQLMASRAALETGIGMRIEERLIPQYNMLFKKLSKSKKVDKGQATVISTMWMAHAIKGVLDGAAKYKEDDETNTGA